MSSEFFQPQIVQSISDESCIGDSLEIINQNFENIQLAIWDLLNPHIEWIFSNTQESVEEFFLIPQHHRKILCFNVPNEQTMIVRVSPYSQHSFFTGFQITFINVGLGQLKFLPSYNHYVGPGSYEVKVLQSLQTEQTTLQNNGIIFRSFEGGRFILASSLVWVLLGYDSFRRAGSGFGGGVEIGPEDGSSSSSEENDISSPPHIGGYTTRTPLTIVRIQDPTIPIMTIQTNLSMVTTPYAPL